MGLDQILSCEEHKQATIDFMNHPKIELLISKISNYYMENIRSLLVIDMQHIEDEDGIH